jgi:hypothetical protein
MTAVPDMSDYIEAVRGLDMDYRNNPCNPPGVLTGHR